LYGQREESINSQAVHPAETLPSRGVVNLRQAGTEETLISSGRKMRARAEAMLTVPASENKQSPVVGNRSMRKCG